jgi:hypothetical protein
MPATFASLSVAKDPGSSRKSVNTVNYGGSSPKKRAQNDSTSDVESKWPARRFSAEEAKPATDLGICLKIQARQKNLWLAQTCLSMSAPAMSRPWGRTQTPASTESAPAVLVQSVPSLHSLQEGPLQVVLYHRYVGNAGCWLTACWYGQSSDSPRVVNSVNLSAVAGTNAKV